MFELVYGFKCPSYVFCFVYGCKRPFCLFVCICLWLSIPYHVFLFCLCFFMAVNVHLIIFCLCLFMTVNSISYFFCSCFFIYQFTSKPLKSYFWKSSCFIIFTTLRLFSFILICIITCLSVCQYLYLRNLPAPAIRYLPITFHDLFLFVFVCLFVRKRRLLICRSRDYSVRVSCKKKKCARQCGKCFTVCLQLIAQGCLAPEIDIRYRCFV